MYCDKCGAQTTEGATVCEKCGKSLDTSASKDKDGSKKRFSSLLALIGVFILGMLIGAMVMQGK